MDIFSISEKIGEEVKKHVATGNVYETNLRGDVAAPLAKATDDAAAYLLKVEATFRKEYSTALLGQAFIATCESLGVAVDNRVLRRFVGAAVFVEIDGRNEWAPEVLVALGSGCCEDPEKWSLIFRPGGPGDEFGI